MRAWWNAYRNVAHIASAIQVVTTSYNTIFYEKEIYATWMEHTIDVWVAATLLQNLVIEKNLIAAETIWRTPVAMAPGSYLGTQALPQQAQTILARYKAAAHYDRWRLLP